MTQEKNAEKVDSLFRAIRGALPQNVDDPWLKALEGAALRARPGWQGQLDSYTRGLERAGAISPELGAQWREQARHCFSAEMNIGQLVLPLVWTILVSLSTLAWLSNQIDRAHATVGAMILAAAALTWAHRTNWMPTSQVSKPILRYGFAATLVFALAIVGGILVPGAMSEIAKEASYSRYKAEQRNFADDVKGFQWIRLFAKREFGVDVVLAAPQDSWSRTSLALRGSSPAIMNLGNGLCELSMSPESIINRVSAPAGGDTTLWLRGVAMHELAHCLDVRRDFQGPGGVWSGSVLAIAPADRHPIQDGSSYYKAAAESLSTQLWREALADTMAVAFWRLNADPATARSFALALRARRADQRENDPVHATMCWIDLAQSEAPPHQNAAIFGWAVSVRANPTCSSEVRS